jgi:hypothetical protein
MVDRTSSNHYVGRGDVYYVEGGCPFPKEDYIKIMKIIWVYEKNVMYNKSDVVDINTDLDESFPSYGSFQIVNQPSKSGPVRNIERVLDIYEKMCGDDYDKDLMQKARGVSKFADSMNPTWRPGEKDAIVDALRQLGKDPRMSTAQTQWYWENPYKAGYELFKDLGFKSLFALYLCSDSYSHGGGKRKQNISAIKGTNDEGKKIEYFINGREEYLRSIGHLKWGGNVAKIADWRRNMCGSDKTFDDYNLKKPHKWKGKSI